MKIDFSRRIGTFKHLNAINMGPIISNKFANELTEALYQKLNFSAVRLHDVPHNNTNLNLVDIHHIFPFFHADPEEPQNYCFEQTDAYIAQCVKLGLEIEYRLGESIEHGRKQFFTHPPQNFTKWARICSRIIAHYNEGWANGFHWNLKYWVVWCEPNEPKLWTGTIQQYFDLYETTARIIKADHPTIKVGGPAWGGGGWQPEKIEDFIRFCRERNLPLDFIAWNSYDSNVRTLVQPAFTFKNMAGKYGFPNAELHLGEWHYLPRSWRALKTYDFGSDIMNPVYGTQGFDSAAYTVSALLQFEDTPLDLAFFYHGNAGPFGILDANKTPTKLCSALEAYGTLMRYPCRVETQDDEFSPEVQKDLNTQKGDLSVQAGIDEHGNACAIIVSFFCLKQELTVEINGLKDYDVNIRVIDQYHDFDNAVFTRRNDTITIRKPSTCAVYLLDFQHKS